MNIQKGQHSIIARQFPGYNREKSSIICEAGNDTGDTFNGTFLVRVYRKGVYRFENEKLTNKI